jgi:hypothetical protein
MAATNGIWLCQNCGKLVDNDSERYTVQLLWVWKLQAEEAALQNIGKPDNLSLLERDARLRFRSSFMPALGELGGGEVDPFFVLSKSRSIHDTAIVEYRYFVSAHLKDSYEKAVREFQTVRDSTQPGIISFYQLQATGTTTGPTVEQIVAAIESLLTFTQS